MKTSRRSPMQMSSKRFSHFRIFPSLLYGNLLKLTFLRAITIAIMCLRLWPHPAGLMWLCFLSTKWQVADHCCLSLSLCVCGCEFRPQQLVSGSSFTARPLATSAATYWTHLTPCTTWASNAAGSCHSAAPLMTCSSQAATSVALMALWRPNRDLYLLYRLIY